MRVWGGTPWWRLHRTSVICPQSEGNLARGNARDSRDQNHFAGAVRTADPPLPGMAANDSLLRYRLRERGLAPANSPGTPIPSGARPPRARRRSLESRPGAGAGRGGPRPARPSRAATASPGGGAAQPPAGPAHGPAGRRDSLQAVLAGAAALLPADLLEDLRREQRRYGPARGPAAAPPAAPAPAPNPPGAAPCRAPPAP